jgi:hypothetical protein
MLINFTPSNENAFGVALLAGRVVGTVQGSTGHITVRATCKAKREGSWATVPYEKATHVFLDVPGADGDFADKIGTYYPPTAAKWQGHFFDDRHADPLRVKAARYLLDTISGANNGTHVLKSERCARCSKELTHPDSIFAMFGPECIKHVAPFMQNASGTEAGAHQTKNAPTTMKDGREYGTPPADAPAVADKQAPPLKHPVDMTDAELHAARDHDGDQYDKELKRRDLHKPTTLAEGNVEVDMKTEDFAKTATAIAGFEPPKPSAKLAESPIVAILKAGDDPQLVLESLKA